MTSISGPTNQPTARDRIEIYIQIVLTRGSPLVSTANIGKLNRYFVWCSSEGASSSSYNCSSIIWCRSGADYPPLFPPCAPSLSVRPSVRLSVCPSVRLSVCLSYLSFVSSNVSDLPSSFRTYKQRKSIFSKCNACASAKRRCDGKDRCSLCFKRGVRCVYSEVCEAVYTWQCSFVPVCSGTCLLILKAYCTAKFSSPKNPCHRQWGCLYACMCVAGCMTAICDAGYIFGQEARRNWRVFNATLWSIRVMTPSVFDDLLRSSFCLHCGAWSVLGNENRCSYNENTNFPRGNFDFSYLFDCTQFLFLRSPQNADLQTSET